MLKQDYHIWYITYPMMNYYTAVYSSDLDKQVPCFNFDLGFGPRSLGCPMVVQVSLIYVERIRSHGRDKIKGAYRHYTVIRSFFDGHIKSF